MTVEANARTLAHVRALMRQLDEDLARLEGEGSGVLDLANANGEQRLDLLLAFAGSFLTPIALHELIASLLQQLLAIAGARRAYLSVRQVDQEPVEAIQSSVREEAHLRKVERVARAVVTKMLESGEPLTIPNLPSHADFQAIEPPGDMGPVICLPFAAGEEGLTGGLYLEREPLAAPFNPTDLSTLRALMRFMSRAIPASRHMQAQQDSSVQLTLLNRLYEVLSQSLELDQVLDHIAQVTLEVTEAERAFILLMAGEQLFFGGGRGLSGPLTQQDSRDISRSVCRKVVETKEGVYVYDMADSSEFAQRRSVVSLHINSVVAVPLFGPQGLSGVLYVDARNKVLTALQHKLSVLTTVSRVAGLAVESAKLYRQATVDSLTNLYVRSFFLLRLEEEIRRSRRYGRTFTLLVLDIDHFKVVNDTHGHQAGDEALVAVAGAVTRSIRAGVDMPGRYGGDEMVLLLPETPLQGALIVAERIRSVVATSALAAADGSPIPVTVSIGVGVFPAMGDSASQLFARADQALYQAKQAGRNCVRVWQE